MGLRPLVTHSIIPPDYYTKRQVQRLTTENYEERGSAWCAALYCIAAADALEAAGDNSQISRKTTEDIAKMANDMESEYTCKKPIRLFSTCDFDSNLA